MSDRERAHAGVNPQGGGNLSPEQAENDIFGFWTFLMSDAVVFALLFATYGVMVAATAGGPAPVDAYKIGPAFEETLALLTSSLTFGLASLSMKSGDRVRTLLIWLSVTLALGLFFLGLELNDFATMFHQGAVPTRSGYLSSFFALVPLHGLHVAAGCLWILVMMAQITTIGLDPRVRINLMRLGLFWHFLDIVWIAIFSVVYLQGLIR